MIIFMIAWSVIIIGSLGMAHYWKHEAEDYLNRAIASANECLRLQHELIFLRQKYEEAKRLGVFTDEQKEPR